MSSGKTETIYIFDSSPFITLYQTDLRVLKIPATIWNELDKLMSQGKIVSHRVAYEEMVKNPKNPDWLSRWIGPKRQFFLQETAKQAMAVSKIMSKFPKLIDPKQEQEQADPWIVALASEQNGKGNLFATTKSTVVSQESITSPQKIPAVCRDLKLRHLSLKQFFEERRIEFSVTSRETK